MTVCHWWKSRNSAFKKGLRGGSTVGQEPMIGNWAGGDWSWASQPCSKWFKKDVKSHFVGRVHPRWDHGSEKEEERKVCRKRRFRNTRREDGAGPSGGSGCQDALDLPTSQRPSPVCAGGTYKKKRTLGGANLKRRKEAIHPRVQKRDRRNRTTNRGHKSPP